MENETVIVFFLKNAAGEYMDGCTTEYEWAKEQAEDWEGATVWEAPVTLEVQKAVSSDSPYSANDKTKDMAPVGADAVDAEIIMMFFLKNAEGDYADGCTTEYEWAKEQAEDFNATVWEAPVVLHLQKAVQS